MRGVRLTATTEASRRGVRAVRWTATATIGLLYASAIGDWFNGPLAVIVCVGSLYAVPALVAVWIVAWNVTSS